MDFPLYNVLLLESEKNKSQISRSQQQIEVFKQLNKLNKEYYELVYVIIFSHYLTLFDSEKVEIFRKYYTENGNTQLVAPDMFKGNLCSGGKGISFTLNEFSDELIGLLFAFLSKTVTSST